MRFYRKALLTGSVLAFALTGCAGEPLYTAAAGGIVGYRYFNPDKQVGQPIEEVYCYGTLATADCYANERPQQAYHMSGKDGEADMAKYDPEQNPFIDKPYADKTFLEKMHDALGVDDFRKLKEEVQASLKKEDGDIPSTAKK